MTELDYDYLASLVQKIQDGDTDSFAELYSVTYQRQYSFACQFVRDPYLAQDILQELYIHALKHIKQLRNPRLFVSWLNQINFRLCFDMSRKNKRNQKELCLEEAAPALSGSASDSEDPIDRYSRRLKYYHDMKLDEIAFAMGCSKSSVKRYLSRGYEKLRTTLEDFPFIS